MKMVFFLEMSFLSMSNPFFLVNAKPQCTTDNECSLDKTCSQGTCVFACSLVTCGLNAYCEPRSHKGFCQCSNGYSGNPEIACTKGKKF